MIDPILALVRRHDPDRFLTALFAPPVRRDALLTLYAFDYELARAREVTTEPHLALIRLHWWREVVEGAVRRHDVATPLSELLASGQLTQAHLLPIIDAYEVEVEPAIESIADWRAWLLEGPGGVAVAAAHVLEAPDSERFRALGAAHGVARLVRWNGILASRGRCLLPREMLAAHSLTIEEAIAAPTSAPVTAALGQAVREGLAFLNEFSVSGLPRACIAAALPRVLVRRDLRRGPVAATGPRGFTDRLAVTWAGLLARL